MALIRLVKRERSIVEGSICSEMTLPYAIRNQALLEEKIEEMFVQWREPIYRYLVAAFGTSVEAEDVTQESFVQLYRAVRAGRSIENARAWLYRTAHNRALDQIKHQRFVTSVTDATWEGILEAIPGSSSNPEESLLENERMLKIHQSMGKLTDQERQCLHLRSSGFRYREIAEIMNIAVPTVGEYLRRGINKLSA